jgi:Mce-associated membrane protein
MTADDKIEHDNVGNVSDVEPCDGMEIELPSDTALGKNVGTDETRQDDTTARATTPGKSDGVARRRHVKVVPVVLVLLLVVSSGLAAWLYFSQYRPDEQTDVAAAQTAVDAARDGTVALLSYKPDTLDQDFAAAKSHLTGDFLNYYDQFTQQIVSPAAKEKAVMTTAQVVRAAASEQHSNSAVVLVFVNQTTISKDRPDPAMAASSVLVSLTKVGGKWLITKFDPV